MTASTEPDLERHWDDAVPFDDVPFDDVPPDEWAPADDGYEPPLDWAPSDSFVTAAPARSLAVQAPAVPRAAPARFATAAEALHAVFGYDSFRGEQAEIIDQVAGGGDAVVLMPTGGGKSLCYQIPALLREGTGIVVSPLIALMHDQVDALSAVGVRAAYLNSTQSPAERASVERAYLSGELDLLYI